MATIAGSRLALAGCALGLVVVLLDVSVVNVALDALGVAFSTRIAGLEWVVNAYTLPMAALLLMAGALGDRWGARRIFMGGFVLFTIASLACGLARTLPALVLARVLQGAGAALLVPNSLSLLQQAFPDRDARSRAVGWWGAAGGIALAAGPVVGGVLVAHLGWRSIFLVNVPLGAIGCGIAWRHTPASAPNAQRTFDLPGQAAAVLALAALAFALTDAARLGWASPAVIAAACVAVAAGASFIAIERRVAAPMLPLMLFRSRGFAIASASGVLVNFAYYGQIFVFSLFFQWHERFSPQQTGLAFLPMTLVLMAASIAGGSLIARIGARRLMVLGQALAASGYLLLLLALAAGRYAVLVVPMLLAATGTALTVPTMVNLTLSGVESSRAGIASGVLNTARQVGGMLGVAVCGYLVRDLAHSSSMRGVRLSLCLAAALMSAGALASHAALKREG